MHRLKRNELTITKRRQAGFSHVELLFAVIIVAAVAFVGVRVLTSSNADTGLSGSSGPTGFSVVGNKIIGPNGKRWTNYGFVLECLAYQDPENVCQNGGASGFTDLDKIRATANYWNGNAVRLQVAPENLFDNSPVDQQFVNLMDNEVNVANNLGLTVVLSLQEEEYGGPVFPTQNAVKFWTWMANHYKNNPHVMFDLYNEPQLTVPEAGSEDRMWNIWQNGGTAADGNNYVGFQALVNAVRGTGANNIVIAESNLYDSDLSELPTHYLNGKNIAYGVETNLYPDSRDESGWYQNFGQYTKDVPILSEAFRDNVGHTCDPNSQSDVPALLDYLDSLHMGVFYWTLEAGLSTQAGSITNPTSYAGHPVISCPANLAGINPNNAVGPGVDLKKFFTDGTSSNSNPLTVNITNPNDGATVNGGIDIRVNSSGGVVRSKVTWDTTNVIRDATTQGADGWGSQWDSAKAPDGKHILRVTVWDAAGDDTSDSIVVTTHNGTSQIVNPPSQPPTIDYAPMIDGSYLHP